MSRRSGNGGDAHLDGRLDPFARDGRGYTPAGPDALYGGMRTHLLERHAGASFPSPSELRELSGCSWVSPPCAQGELSRFDTVAESAIQGLADVLAACTPSAISSLPVFCAAFSVVLCWLTDIVEVGSSAQAQAEFAGRAESNLIDVMLVLQSRAEGESAPWAELLQLIHTPAQRLPTNLLSGGPLSSADVRGAALMSGASSPPQRTSLPGPLTSDGREYRETVGFLPALPARHTFVAPEPPTLSVDAENCVSEHSAQRRRTAARRQIELNLCKLRAIAVAQDRPPGDGAASLGADDEKDPESGIKTVVGLGAAVQLSAMNERAGRYARDASAGGLWAQNGLSPQMFLNNQALLAAARSVRAPKRKREEVVATQQPLQLEDAVQTQHLDKAESADKAPEPLDGRPSPFKRALVLGNSSGAMAAEAASATTSAPVSPAPIAADESDDDDKPLAPPKRLALTIGNKSRPSLSIKSNRAAAPANSAECSVQPRATATTAALPSASPASSSVEQSPVAGIGSSGDISMSHPKLMGQCLKMLEEIKAYASSWPFLAPGGSQHSG